jgi:ABC-2 type transport system permease protein
MNRDTFWTGAITDAITMIQRSARLSRRSPDAMLPALLMPVLLMVLFVYVFGGAIETGTRYIDYVVPGIIILCASFGSATTAVGVCSDMVGGIMDRFRSMPIIGWTVLLGHVTASLGRNLLSAAFVVGIAWLMGFRSSAGPLQWVAAAGLLLLFVFAISWFAVVLGLVARQVEAANGFTFVLLFLPYISSAFVPTSTMPAWLRVVAEHQPITPVSETMRALLDGSPMRDNAILAIAWCVGIAFTSCIVAAWLFRGRTAG